MTRITLATAIALVLTASAATAQTLSTSGNSYARGLPLGPSASHPERTWVNPANGCSYSRAQAPGYAPTWHLIFNGSRIGLTDAHTGCPQMLNSR